MYMGRNRPLRKLSDTSNPLLRGEATYNIHLSLQLGSGYLQSIFAGTILNDNEFVTGNFVGSLRVSPKKRTKEGHYTVVRGK